MSVSKLTFDVCCLASLRLFSDCTEFGLYKIIRLHLLWRLHRAFLRHFQTWDSRHYNVRSGLFHDPVAHYFALVGQFFPIFQWIFYINFVFEMASLFLWNKHIGQRWQKYSQMLQLFIKILNCLFKSRNFSNIGLFILKSSDKLQIGFSIKERSKFALVEELWETFGYFGVLFIFDINLTSNSFFNNCINSLFVVWNCNVKFGILSFNSFMHIFKLIKIVFSTLYR